MILTLVQWKRLSPTVHLSPADMTKLPAFHIQVTAHLEMESNNDLTANYMSVPRYDAVWAGIYSSTSTRSGYHGCYSNSDIDYDDVDRGDDDDDDESRDGFDPINFWRYKGAPADMLDMVKRSDEEMARRVKEGIARWAQGVSTAGQGDYDEVQEED